MYSVSSERDFLYLCFASWALIADYCIRVIGNTHKDSYIMGSGDMLIMIVKGNG